ncbi:amino acid permease [Arthrobacter sp. AL12]|uniref:APC family permease n=1 Tax=Arthrobacter sp. AL12 TaxID=3042241 RepID=UPI00249B9BA4|nr:amino acid permease [Arthrobacter sp. AL12]MDI3212163.1 amino acid permease [Arthrobacter sp. AL12]
MAFSFAEMSRQQPDAGGIAHFVARACGRRASAVAGYLFYFAIPFGAPATAVIGGNYIAHALGGGRGTALAAAGLLLTAAFAGNAVGIRMSSGIQLVLMVLLVGLLALALAAPYARAENFEPFAPHGYWAVGGVASLLFFCFAGWEAVTRLAGEFRHPERDLKRATWLTLVVVGWVRAWRPTACCRGRSRGAPVRARFPPPAWN